MSGWSYRQIARAVGLRSAGSVHHIVKREMGHGGGRGRVITDLGRTLFVERSEAMLAAHWPAGLAGDHRVSKLCLGLFDEQARFYGLRQTRVNPTEARAQD